MQSKMLFVALVVAAMSPTFGYTADLETPMSHLRVPPAAMQMPYVIEFGPGATIDFADMTQRTPGPLRGYVYLRMQGELVVVPVYQPTPDGSIWRTGPQWNEPPTAPIPQGPPRN